MPYKPAPWSAHGVDWTLEWSPTPPHLRGTPGAVAITQHNLLQGNLLTPTGPVVEGDESDPLAVLAALPEEADLAGSPPPMPGVPEDAVS